MATCSVAAPPGVGPGNGRRGTVLRPPPRARLPAPTAELKAGKGCGMWNPEPRPCPSSHRSSSLGSSPSFQILPHQARATFCSRLSTRLPCFLTCLPSYHSEARIPESLLLARRPPGRKCKAHFRFRSVSLWLRVL